MDKTWELCLEHTVFQDMEAVETQKKIPVILKGEKKGMRNFVPDFLTGFRMDGDRVTARAVLDAKYRKAWETVCATGKHWDEFVRADVFQVFGYMYVTGAELGGIIAPVRQQEAQKAALRDYPICEGMEQRFCVIPLVIPNGAGKDYQTFRTEMDASCARCAAAVRKLTAPKQE